MNKLKPVTFQWISNRTTTPYVTLDSQNRLYISSPTRDLMNLPEGKFRLNAGYDFVNHRVVLAKPEVVKVPNNRPFKFDKRSYSKAKTFIDRAKLGAILPARFIYVGRDFSEFPDGSYVFQLEGHIASDGIGEDVY